MPMKSNLCDLILIMPKIRQYIMSLITVDFVDKGKYIYIRSWWDSKTAEIKSPTIVTAKERCLTFWYRLIATSNSSSGAIIQVFQAKGNDLGYAISNYSQQVDEWTKAQVQLIAEEAYEVVIKGTIHGETTGLRAVAIDDVDIISGICSDNLKITCNFERNNCFLDSSLYRHQQWQRVTPEERTPDHDHTIRSEFGHYFQILTSNDAASGQLKTPFISISPLRCLSFWYFITGSSIKAFKVFQGTKNVTIDLSPADEWRKSVISLNGTAQYQIILTAEFDQGTDDNERSITVDEISLTQAVCQETYTKECVQSNGEIQIDTCAKQDLLKDSFDLAIESRHHPIDEICESKKNVIEESIGLNCNTFNDELCVISLDNYLHDANDCFVISEVDTLQVSYTCTGAGGITTQTTDSSTLTDADAITQQTTDLSTLPDSTKLGLQTSNTDSLTGIIAGTVGGIGAIICVSVVLIFILRRSKSKPKLDTGSINGIPTNNPCFNFDSRKKYQNETNASSQTVVSSQYELDYNRIDHQDVVQNELIHPVLENKRNGPDYINVREVHNGSEYAFIDPERKKNSKKFSDVEAAPTCDYEILDPDVTGFDRTNWKRKLDPEYEFASCVNSDEIEERLKNIKVKSADQYATTGEDEYHSTNVHHEESENLYSHMTDSVYDTANHSRQDYDEDDTYDHFVSE